ncbi:uncharacterized protein LOC114180586 [Vigna unguiculata]|uniref:uncharacterized protein LOC114180586 n=1 Tax=Vigna unguiculata TaxID=3917 RepID=UPI0010161BDA|nr:uncharacterized protein LOC114180586 [Vigna unguiculata]
MDQSWINFLRTTNEYENGVEEFLEFANMNVLDNNGKFYCPCVNCLNERKLPTDIIGEHVLCDDFLKSYTKWIWHGELIDMPSVDVSEAEEVDLEMDDQMEEMIRDIGHDSFQRANVYDNLCNDAEKHLYAECTKYTRLSAVLKLFNVKAKNGWTDKSFTELLELLSDMLPKGNTLPTRNYDAKKILCLMGMEYQKIHACPNDCVLYRKELAMLHQCPWCGVSRYKQKHSEFESDSKGPPAKVLWYLPVVSRLKRLFSNANDAKLMR